MNARVLFLYISASSGHQKAADAVREALALLNPGWESFGEDAFTYAYPTVGKLIGKTYLEMLRHTPAIWDFVYDNPDVVTATKELRELLNLISWPKMKKLLRKHTPQAVVCTQAVPCSVFAYEKRKGNINVPLIAVVTDFAIHSYWVYPEVDLYCVSSEDSRRELIKRGIEASRIVVTGIPISPTFLRHHSPEGARAQIRLDTHRPTVLIMGGSQGLGPLQETIEKLHAMPIQIVVATGMNRDLFRSLRKSYSRDRRVKIFGYTKTINLLMDAADMLITKPGGMTSSEALAKSVPMIITNPIPGQEERNARFLVRHGVAERADSSEEIASTVATLLSNPTRLRKMTEKAVDLARPYAAMEVARHIFRMVSASKPGSYPFRESRLSRLFARTGR